MKKTILLLAGILLLAINNASAGNIDIGVPGGSGGVQVSGTWTTGNNYIIHDHMIIAVGSSLTIQPGVNVLIADTLLKIELICLGNFYCQGTKQNPVSFSVQSNLIPANKPFPGLWGGIICDTTCSEFLMLYTNIMYFGGPTGNNSPSVLLHLYKNAAGETEPAVNYRDHNGGKIVIMNSVFSNGLDDAIYIEGGNAICAYNTDYQSGFTGGEFIDIKAGTIADLAYNFCYSQNTNAFKLSNTGSRSPQANIVEYNNTIVNTGWRRPTVKGGSIWYEAGVIGKSYNNLFINTRFGIKTKGDHDTASRADYNYYYGYWQNVVNNFTNVSGLYLKGSHDILGTTPGDKDPLLVNYPLNTDTMNSAYNTAWDFHLKSTSPAIGVGTLNVPVHFATNGITILSVTYKSPSPSTTIGAFGKINTGVSSLDENNEGLSVYPNPFSNKANLKIIVESSGIANIRVCNIVGEPVYQHSEMLSAGEHLILLDASNWATGIYLVTLKTGSRIYSQKIVVSK